MTATAAKTSDQRHDPALAEKRGDEVARLHAKAYAGLPEKAAYVRRLKELQTIRQPMERIWREVRDFLLPYCGRFLNGDDSDPDDESYSIDNSHIKDSSATKMAITAADGLHGGLTSPATQWFSYYVGNYDRYKDETSEEVKQWVYNAQECVRDTLANSNFYTAIHTFYLEALAFATAVMLILSDPDDRARYYTKTVGSYWLGQDEALRIDTVYVKYSVRASEIVRKYGRDNCPERVVRTVEEGRGDRRFFIIQCIQPWNYFGDAGRHPDYRFEDVRFVEGGADDEPALYRGGYRTKPFVVARWADSGDYVYGRSCPGIDALPDIKQLQLLTTHFNMGSEWTANPAWGVNSAAAQSIDRILPGHIYKIPSADPKTASLVPLVPPVFDFNTNIQARAALLERIGTTMYQREMLLVQSRQRQITATEVTQLVQEKNTVLGPITVRMGNNVLMPGIDRTFEIVTEEWRVLPPAPEEIQGQQIKPYFTSALAKAQRQSAIMDANMALQFLLAVYPVNPEIAYSVDFDAWLRQFEATDMLPPAVMRSKQFVEEAIAAVRQAQAQQMQQARAEQAVGMAKTLGDTSTAPDTAFGQMANGEPA